MANAEIKYKLVNRNGEKHEIKILDGNINEFDEFERCLYSFCFGGDQIFSMENDEIFEEVGVGYVWQKLLIKLEKLDYEKQLIKLSFLITELKKDKIIHKDKSKKYGIKKPSDQLLLLAKNEFKNKKKLLKLIKRIEYKSYELPRIKWLGTETQLVFLFHELKDSGLIADDTFETTGKGYKVLENTFINKNGNKFKNSQLAQAYQNIGNKGPKKKQILNDILIKVKKIE